MADQKCRDRIRARLNDRMTALRAFMKDPEGTEESGPFNEYGLSFDYVAPGTFRDQRRGYYRYQLSWGGPSDEFRFYVDQSGEPYKIQYWFLDWFDGAHVTLTPGSNRWNVLRDVWQYFDDCDCPRTAYEQATA